MKTMNRYPKLRRWFFPVWSGDFRLEKTGDDTCVLTVEDPTPADRALLEPFFPMAKELGFLARMPTVKAWGKTTVELTESIAVVGPVLAQQVKADGTTWTAVRHTSGVITLGDGTVLTRPTAPDPSTDLDPKQTPQLPAVPEPVAAATVAAPSRGCPAPTATERRASEVLRSFSTVSQWQDWQRLGSMRLIGSHTGKSYRVFHRDEAAARGMSHVLVARGTGEEVCVWDDRVPAEEEVLGIKLAVEHREGWLLGLPAPVMGKTVAMGAIDAAYGYAPVAWKGMKNKRALF